jgi:hypothetical protein
VHSCDCLHSRAWSFSFNPGCWPWRPGLYFSASNEPAAPSRPVSTINLLASEALGEFALQPPGVFNTALLDEDRNSEDNQVGGGDPLTQRLN